MSRHSVHTRDFVGEAAEWIADAVGDAVAARGAAVVGLCGGSTPREIYAALADMHLPWERIVWTFGDERCVPPDDERSNFRMAKEALFDRAGIDAGRIVRIEGEREPAEAARACEERLRQLPLEEGVLRHDLLLLGLGEDGHTASLFPGTTALGVADRWVVENRVQGLDAWRVTFTFPLINASREILFLVNGESKRAMVEAVHAGGGRYPAERVAATAGAITWLLGFPPALKETWRT